jgi:polyferredoxin
MPLGTTRDKVLRGLARKRGHPHRYTVVRWVVAIGATAVIALIPATGVLRFDLWGGNHVYLEDTLGFAEVARRFAFPFLAVNIAIVLASRFLGRYLCGFVCPYGALARLSEWARATRSAAFTNAVLLAASLLLAAITFSFWIDWRVFTSGTPLALSLAAAFLLGTTAASYATVRWLGLAFCRDWCPSGVYFAVLGHDTNAGIAFAHPEACTDCRACESVCPVDLHPRQIASVESRAGTGFYPDGLSNHALCIRCGDCVVACEQVTARDSDVTPLELGWLRTDAARADEAQQDTDAA